jgi:hypothetical protein
MPLSIEDAVNKYSGGDAAYALKLKSGIRDSMGYSNYMSKLGQATSAVAPIGDVSGLSPAGINSRISSRFGAQNANISTLSNVTSAIDSAAGSLASAQAAREKAGAAANQRYGINNGVMYNPQGQLDTQINDYMKNPYNQDGSTKSLQQFESEMNRYYSDPANQQTSAKNVDAQGNLIPTNVHDAAGIKTAIDARVPKDFIGNETLYSAMAQGYSRKQASDPSTAGAVRDAMQTKSVTTTDPATGQSVNETLPKFTTTEIQNKYPDLTDVEVKGIMKPVEQKAMVDDIQKDPLHQIAQGIIQTGVKAGTNPGQLYVDIMATPEYKALENSLTHEYPNFTAKEIGDIIYNQIRA